METREAEFQKKLLATFQVEAQEHLQAISSGLVELEKTPSPQKQKELVETVFREAHSLKGASRAVNLTAVETVCQSLESVFSSLKRQEKACSPELFDQLHQTVDKLGKLISSGGEKRLGAGLREEPAPPAPKAQSLGTVRVASSKLDRLLLQAEELLSSKLAMAQIAKELREADSPSALKNLRKLADQEQRSLGAKVENLLEEMKKALMLPFSLLLEIFPKLVRDLSREQGKEVELVIEGGEIEIDRRILEEMKDPLIHLVRNCLDHGIEKPEERVKKKKLPEGTIKMTISQKNGSKVEITVTDDGGGIPVEKVVASAEKLGSVTPAQAREMSEPEKLSLIFQSGISTSPFLTDLSGRGLGLAIVREKVEKLGGLVSVETRRDQGTTFRIVLPMTLATFRGMLVRSQGELFVIPTAKVERVMRIQKEQIKTVENRGTIPLNGQAISLVRLSDALELPRGADPFDSKKSLPAVVLGSGPNRIAFLVDEVVDEQEVLVKTLGKQLARVSNIAGATVLGSGKVAPILNVADLLKSAVKESKPAAEAAAAPSKKKEEVLKRSVLVVEDSITARSLLKNILESAGYVVKTAVDGVDGFTRLRTDRFDAVVSDVDMPRMNGFALTEKIRGDKKLAELPVVLVTALESREDKERGVDAGANAYLVKSSFDQSNLLEVLRRLI